MEKQPKKPMRKSPQRDPIRKLFMEKARLEFELRTLDEKCTSENARHAQTTQSLDNAKSDVLDRLSDIDAALHDSEAVPQ